MSKNKYLIVPVLICYFLLGCNLTQDIDVELPDYQPELVLECYLEEGQPYKLFLSETSSYFDSIQLPLINDALVTISHNGIIDTIPYLPLFDPVNFKLYNYRLDKKVVRDDEPYILNITDKQGRSIQAETRFLSVPEIKEIETTFRQSDSLAYLALKIIDPPGERNFYRILTNSDTLSKGPQINYLVDDDRGFDGKDIPIFTNYRYADEDTIIIRTFQIEENYHTYLESVRDANRANGNPFVQPAQIKSAVRGGIGIFAALSYRTDTVYFNYE